MDCYMYAMFAILIAIPWSESEANQTVKTVNPTTDLNNSKLTSHTLKTFVTDFTTIPPTNQFISTSSLFHTNSQTDQSISYTSKTQQKNSLTYQSTSDMTLKSTLPSLHTDQSISYTSETQQTKSLTYQSTSDMALESKLASLRTNSTTSYMTEKKIKTALPTLTTGESTSDTTFKLPLITVTTGQSTSYTTSNSSLTPQLPHQATSNMISEKQLTTQLTHQYSSNMKSESPLTTPLTLQPTSNTVLSSPLTTPFTTQSSTKTISKSPLTTATSQTNQITSFTSSDPPITASPTKHIPPDTTSQLPPNSTTSINQINVTRDTTQSSNEISTHSDVKSSSTTPDSKLSYSHALDTLEIVLPFKVEINKTFKKELRNSNSVYYRNVSQEFKLKLEKQFRNTAGFSHITITGFSNGSIVCNYIAVYEKVKDITHFSNQFEAVRQSIQNTPFLGKRPESVEDMSDIVSKASKDLCKITRPCRPGFLCTSKGNEVECTNPCAVNPCKNKGECFYDIQTETSGCRCVPDDKYVYSGPQCTEQVESLALSSTQIIIICACSGGVVIIILFTVIVCLVIRRNKTLKQPRDRNQSKPSKMNDLYPDRWDNMPRSRENTVMNEYQSGLPDIALVDGREHMVLKSTHGNETYIYQPSLTKSRPVSLISSEFDTRSVSAGSTYDYIDPEANYQIKRPSIKVGYLNQM